MKKLFVWIVLAGLLVSGDLSGAPLHNLSGAHQPLTIASCQSAPDRLCATDTTETVKHFMQKVQQAYHDAPYLSFHLLYRYANKSQPANYIDSMAGEIAMDKNRLRLVMDDIETITNDKYTIQVMKENKLIYLSVPKSVGMTDPLSMLDTTLAHLQGVRTQIVHAKGLATLSISFPQQPGQLYKNIVMTVNESTGYLQKVVYDLFTSDLVSQDQLSQSGKAGLYQPEGRIEVLFSQYRKGEANDSLFNEARFFTRLAKGNYEPSEQYKDYQIFLASANL
jgi:hypothetical protein